MNESALQSRRHWAVIGLTAAAVVLLIAVYYVPVWWVSLKAPNYPAEAFPDGVRISFHFNGVFNGCTLHAKHEISEEKALDCVHEMDAINHFVGMFPIASGGVVEKFFSPFLLSFVAVLAIGFTIRNPKLRVGVMAACFAVIAIWMSLAFLAPGGIRYQSAAYLDAMVVSLGQGQEEEGEEQSPIIAALKKSLIESGAGAVSNREELRRHVEAAGEAKLGEALGRLHQGTSDMQAGGGTRSLKEILQSAAQSRVTGKALDIQILKDIFEADQRRKPQAERTPWTGSGAQVMAWHHEKSLGRWFNNPAKNGPIAARMARVAVGLYIAILTGMLAMLFVARNNGPLHWLLIGVPILLPAFFIVEYAAWLWWYGHSLNEMGAFTLKPFMPTVFGQGKVAQFSTHSYPHIGFALLLAVSGLLALAALVQRKELQEEQGTN
jgi:hypothetical protein